MRWDATHQSSNVEDQRGRSSGGGLPIGKMGIGGTIILAVLSLVFGRNLIGSRGVTETRREADPIEDDKLVHFVGFVLDDAQDNWRTVLPAQTRKPYRDAKLVLFTDDVRSGCGYAESAMGPFYCPVDEKVYVDLGFYRELKAKLGAPGDFAQAYVIAHEIGHHVQNILGTDARMREEQQGRSKTDQNELSVMLELQADCFAGIWAKSTDKRDLLEQGDIEEAMNAAAAVGDDRLQKSAGGRVNPEKWTHGSSAMRSRWFHRGFDSGQIDQCDTFHARDL
jgi:predicted metalloprotease